MREIFSFIFERLTEPLGLPIEWYWEWLVLAIVGFAAYAIAYRAVGGLYQNGEIDGRFLGSLIHWIIRIVVFVVIWAVTYGVIWLAKFIFAHWIIVVSTLGGLLVTAAIICIIVSHIKKGGTSNA